MNKPLSLVTLMVALSAGAALAAPTTAGTQIQNTATASFSQESDPTTTTTVNSNTVTTTVSPVPSFTITDTAGLNSTGGQDSPTTNLDHLNGKPGSQQTFAYTVSNTGNTPEVVDLTVAQRTDTSIAPGTVNASGANIFYIIDGNNNGIVDYTDSNGNGKYDYLEPLLNGDSVVVDSSQDSGSTIDTGVIQPGSSVKLLVVFNVPSDAARGAKYGVNPTGTAQYDPSYNPQVPGTINANSSVLNAAGTSTQIDNDNFNRVTIYNAADVVGPNAYPDGNAPTTPTYTEPGGTAIITRNADAQTAAPVASATTTTFINTVKNTGTLADRFNLYYITSSLPAGVTGVQFLKSDGTAFTASDDTDGDGRPDIAVAAGATADFRVKLTYNQANITPPTATVTIATDSVSDGDTNADDTTQDILSVARVVLGDKSGTGAAATYDKTLTGNPTGVPGATVSIPMVVSNPGGQNDTYTLAGTVSFPNTAGGTTTAPVSYVTDPACDGSGTGGTAIAAGTPLSVASLGKACVVAKVTIPSDAKAGTTPAFTQTVTSTTTGSSDTDTNDVVTVQTTGNSYAPVKTVDKTTAKPGDDITYTIVGTNTNNTNLTKYFISDPINANVTFKSLTGSVADSSPAKNFPATTPAVLYSANGTSWFTTVAGAGITNTFTGTVYVAADTNADGALTAADVLKPGQKLNVTLVVTLK